MLDKRRFNSVELEDSDVKGNIRISNTRAQLATGSDSAPFRAETNGNPIPIHSETETNGTPVYRPSHKTQRVIDFFKANPQKLSMSCIELVSEIGVGKTTINDVQNAIRKGDISFE